MKRLSVVDALRGFALLAIVLLHNLEHYNLYSFPEELPNWLKVIDKGVWDSFFFLFAGKAYATFSLLFGFSFFIQLRNERKRGGDFRWRFVWRMVLLALFAQFHSLFYNGDILLLYAVVGLTLIPVCRFSDRTVLIIAAVLMVQPVEWFRATCALLDPEYVAAGGWYGPYWKMNQEVLMNGSFWEVVKSNIWHGQLFSNLWAVENGRLFQTSSLFMLGMVAGRRDWFIRSEESIRFWRRTLIIASITFVPLFLIKTYVPTMVENPSLLVPLKVALPSYANFAFMAILVSGFTLLWFKAEGYPFQRMLIPYGRMSLTNYITQSMIGSVVYYHYGLGLYAYTGATASLIIGIVTFVLQLLFSRYWLARHTQGPFEAIWRRATWIGR